MENKKSFVLYPDQEEIFNILSDEQAGKLIKIIFAYVNDRDPEPEDLILKLAFTPIKNHLKRDLKNWKAMIVRQSENGKLGGRPKVENPKNPVLVSESQKSLNVNDNVNVNENVNDTWDNAKKLFLNDFRWIEKFCRDKTVKQDELKRQMLEFLKDLSLSNQVKPLAELQSHFLHSFNKKKYHKITTDDQPNRLNEKIRSDLRKAAASGEGS